MTAICSQPFHSKTFTTIGRVLLVLLVCSLAGGRAWADERAAVREFALNFYKAYSAARDPGKFVAKSDQITPAFKKAYTAARKKDAESDPIIQGQDVPASGYQAGEVQLSDKEATVAMTTKDKGFSTLKVHLVSDGKHWLLNGVNGLRGK